MIGHLNRKAFVLALAVAFASFGLLEFLGPNKAAPQRAAESEAGRFNPEFIAPAFAQMGGGLVAHWTFEEGSGTTAGDSAGLNDGTLVNGAAFVSDSADGSSFSASFDGIDDHVAIANTPDLEITGTEITLAAWIKPLDAGNPNAGSRVISKRTDAGGSDVYAMYTQFNRLRFRLDGQDMISDHTFLPGEWLHVAMVYDGVDKRIYINGLLDGAAPQAKSDPLDASARAVHLGHREGEGRYFNGAIDDVRIYDQALSAAEIESIVERPIADAGFSRTAALGETVVLDGSGSRSPDELELTYTWSLSSVPPGSAAMLSDPAAVKPRLDIDLPGDYVAVLTVSDGTRQSAPSSVTISTANSPPVANAGLDVSGSHIVSMGVLQALDGSKSWDPDGDPLSFQWRVIAEPVPGTEIISDTSPRTYFESANQGGSIESGRYLFELTVSDGVFSDTDTVAFTANQNLPPLAEAGPHARGLLGVERILDLDGTTDQDGYIDYFQANQAWSLIARPSGSAAALSLPAGSRPRLAADVPGDYVVQLRARDATPSSSWATDTLVVSTQNTPPLASAGPLQTLLTGSLVQLDAGASSDVDEDSLTYRWDLIFTPFGSGAVLSDPEAVRPTFTADLDGIYVAQLTVHDGTEASLPSTVFIAASDLAIDNPDELHYLHPVADAGPDQTALVDELVRLDGSGSFYPDNVWGSVETLAFEWSVVSAPQNSLSEIYEPTAAETDFLFDQPGVYVLQLAVQTVTPSVRVLDTVTISTTGSRPVADAGADQPAAAAPVVQLDGTASSDADGTALDYRWAVLFKPAGSTATLSDPAAATPSLSVDGVGTYVVQLIVDDGALESRPDTVVIEVANTQPVADAGPDRTVVSGSLVQLDGTASSDAENDPLQFSWSLVGLPAGSTAALSDPAAASPSFTADLAGTYVAELLVNDGLAASAPDQVTIAATNAPPVLDPIGNQTVDLGSTLSLTLSGSDLNGDPLSFSAIPLPLPAGARLEAGSGSFSFTPGESQVGDVTLTFAVSDGQRSDTESVTITVVGPQPGGVTALAGRVLDAKAAALGQTVPVQGATVSVVGSGVSGTTDANGDFSLSGLPAGEQVLSIDAQAASPAPDGSAYASAWEDIALIASVTNDPAEPFFLARIDQASAAVYDPGSPSPTTVTSAALGATLEVPAGSATLSGAPFNGTLTLSELPPGQALEILPALIAPCQLMTVQPLGVAFSPPAQVTLPNLDSLPAGTEVDIWSLDPATGRFQTVGTGQVSPGGADITTLSGGIPAAGPLFAVPRGPAVVFAQDENADNRRPSLLADGNLPSAIAIPGVTSLGAARDLTFVYNSAAADAQPIVAAEVTFPTQAGLPPLLQGRLEVGGIETGAPVFMSTSTPADPGDPGLLPGETLRLGTAFEAASLPSGSHPTRFIATSDYGCSKVGTAGEGRVLVSNQSDSPFGSGWTLEGLERLHIQDDGTVVLEDGSGGARAFTALDPGLRMELFDAPGFNPVLAVATGFAGLSPGTFTVTTAAGTESVTGASVPVVNFPDITFDQAAFYNIGPNNLIDSGSTPGAPQGDDIAYQPPGGNETFGASFSGYIFLPEGGDVTFTVGFDDTFQLLVDGQVASEFLSLSDFRTVSATVAGLRSGHVPIVLNYGENTAEANVVLEASGGGLPGGLVPAGFLFQPGVGQSLAFRSPRGDVSRLDRNPDGSFTRRQADGTIATFDSEGRILSRTDRNGNATVYAYDPGSSLLTSITDPAGRVTGFDYLGDKLTGITDPSGRTTTFDLGPDGSLLRVARPDASERRFAYDSNDRLVSETSARGFTTTHGYGAAGRWTGAGLPDGASVSAEIARSLGLADLGLGLGTPANPLPFARPGQQVSRFTDANGNVTSVKLNRFGSPIEITDALGRTTLLERDADDRVVRVTAPSDGALPGGATPGTVVTELDYDGRGNVTAQREAVGTALERQTLFEYEPVFNKVTRILDPGGFETLFEYDAAGNLTKTTDALGGTRVSTYDARGLKLTETDPNAKLTTFAYDIAGNLERITDALGNVTAFATDAAGRVTARTDGLGTPEERTTGFAYDAMNRVTSETDGAGGTTGFLYDAAGNVIEETDPTGIVAFRTYDQRDRLIEEDDPVSGITQFAYDGNGNVTSVTDALGAVTGFEYDAANRLTRSVDALGVAQLFGYDAQDDIVSVTDALGQVTAFERDLLSRVIRRINPLTQTATLSYDSRDNLTGIVDPKGQSIARTYDELSRLTRIATPDNQVDLTYDAASNVTAVTDSDSDLAFTYDALNRVETAATGAGGLQPLVSLTNSFDAVGNRTTLADDAGPSGGTTAYAYDLAGRLTSLTTPAGQLITLTYDAADRSTGIIFPNGVSTGATYDTAGRLGSLAHILGGLDLARFTYGYNALGNITQIAELGQTRNFTYDALLRLTAGGTAAAPESYSYDAEGNRIASHLSAAHVHDAANRLLEDDGFCYGYDANGNLTSKTAKVAGACTGDLTTYAWDAQDRLVRIDFPDLTTATYAYDGLGRRIQKDVNGTVTRYVYDGEDILLEYDGANVLQARYTHGQRTDQPLAIERGATLAYFQADHLGSIRQVTDASGSILNAYDYDSYGTFETRSESLPQPYAFTGREFDPESGLLYYRARYYDPAAGRFISEDPIGFGAGDSNLYRYVFNDPVNLVDPSGLAATKERTGTLQPALRTAPVLYNLGRTLGLVFRSVARDLLIGVLASAPNNPNDPDQPKNPDDDSSDRPGGGGGSSGGGGSGSGSGSGSSSSGSSTGAGEEAPPLGDGDEVNVRTTRQGGPGVRIRRKDGTVIDITPQRVKEFEPEPRAESGLKPKKFDDPLPGSKGKKRRPTQGELELLKALTGKQ